MMLLIALVCLFFFCFKQKTAYEMRISDWSSDVCSSDLHQSRRYVYGEGIFDEAHDIARPADRHGARRDRLFEDQRPADHPCDHLAHHGIAIGIGSDRDGDHRDHFRLAESGEGAGAIGRETWGQRVGTYEEHLAAAI